MEVSLSFQRASSQGGGGRDLDSSSLAGWGVGGDPLAVHKKP